MLCKDQEQTQFVLETRDSAPSLLARPRERERAKKKRVSPVFMGVKSDTRTAGATRTEKDGRR